MDRLQQGARRFRDEEFEVRRELFAGLAHGQQPHTLFIGCSDSRVVPTLITSCGPGELFMVRNVANVVPPHACDFGEGGPGAAIEYAVQVLGVCTIVVCGHSRCAGCAALGQPAAELEGLPLLRRWLAHSGPVPERVDRLLAGNPDPQADRVRLFEQVNVMVQLDNLRTYPCVQAALASAKMTIQGWHYDIGSGEILVLDEATGRFRRMES